MNIRHNGNIPRWVVFLYVIAKTVAWICILAAFVFVVYCAVILSG